MSEGLPERVADRGRCEGPRLEKMLKFAQIILENVTFLDKCQHEFGDFDSAIEMNSGNTAPRRPLPSFH